MTDLAPEDFDRLRKDLAAKWGVTALANQIQRVRMVFKFGFDGGLIDRPIRYGQSFKLPNRRTLRVERARRGPLMFEPDELRRIIEAATVPLKAMILLGVNCGFGNNDSATLPIAAIDTAGGWVNYPRPKTGIPRRAKLWPETILAIAETLLLRPTPRKAEHEGLLFVTKYGRSWAREAAASPVSGQMAKLLGRLASFAAA